MTIRKNVLWKVPVFCLIAGELTFQVLLRLLIRTALVTLPDGSIIIDPVKELILYGIVFLATLLIGRWFFRDMSRKEIFFSASIPAMFGIFFTAIQMLFFPLTTGGAALFFLYIARIFEWSSLIPQLIYKLGGTIWLGAFINCLSPYLFILFGKKEDVQT
ncbi:MAG: hypothetical protein HFI93_09810 [Lachnospiraceae bacterium]|nr:hypothetical protein [Lachnospiraceae bacterium]